MKKKFSVVCVLLAFSLAIAGAHFQVAKEKDIGKTTCIMQAVNPTVDLAFINDAVVPVVLSNHMKHVESVSLLSEGYTPMTERKARAPTIHKTMLSPLPRDKPNDAYMS